MKHTKLLKYACAGMIVLCACEKQSFAPTPAPAQDSETAESKAPDIDLVGMSGNVVYSEVFNIMSDPEAYVGKKIRVEGLASSFFDYGTEKGYYSCIIPDATQCCAQGIEYQFKDDRGTYPADDSTIIVTGIFSPYDDDGYTCYALMDAEVSQ